MATAAAAASKTASNLASKNDGACSTQFKPNVSGSRASSQQQQQPSSQLGRYFSQPVGGSQANEYLTMLTQQQQPQQPTIYSTSSNSCSGPYELDPVEFMQTRISSTTENGYVSYLDRVMT